MLYPCPFTYIILVVADSRQRDTRLEESGVEATYLGTFESGGNGNGRSAVEIF